MKSASRKDDFRQRHNAVDFRFAGIAGNIIVDTELSISYVERSVAHR